MHLAADYIYPTPREGRFRIRVYLPDEERDAIVVVCTELATIQARLSSMPSGALPRR